MTVINKLQDLCQNAQIYIRDIHSDEIFTKLIENFSQQCCFFSRVISISVTDVTVKLRQIDAEILITLIKLMNEDFCSVLLIKIIKDCSHELLKNN